VVGLAPDHHPEAGDAGEAAGLGAPPRPERQLERPRHLMGVNRGRSHPLLPERLHGPVDQSLGEVVVEGRDADRELLDPEIGHARNLSGSSPG
jgi:hypothetical protein